MDGKQNKIKEKIYYETEKNIIQIRLHNLFNYQLC